MTSVNLKLRYQGNPSIIDKPGQPPEISLTLRLRGISQRDGEGFYLSKFRYSVRLWTSVGQDLWSGGKNRMEIGEFQFDKVQNKIGVKFDLTFPLYPEVKEEMNRISSEGKYVAFEIQVLDGLIFWYNDSQTSIGDSLQSISSLNRSTVKSETYGEEIDKVVLNRETLTKLFSKMEGLDHEWISIPVPQFETVEIDGELGEMVANSTQNLRKAREVLHTPEYGQAMLDLREVRDELGSRRDTDDHEPSWYLNDNIRDAIEQVAGKDPRRGIEKSLRSGTNVANKYIHESRPKLEETPPWRETRFVYSQYTNMVWYISKILSESEWRDL